MCPRLVYLPVHMLKVKLLKEKCYNTVIRRLDANLKMFE